VLDMTNPGNIHKPPPQTVIAELVRAGLSPETAAAMERWKAQEVLELLRSGPDAGPASGSLRKRPAGAW
jgi:hypothetical protein